MTRIDHRELARYWGKKGGLARKARNHKLAATYFGRMRHHSEMATNADLADAYTKGRREAEASRKAADAARKREERQRLKANA